MTVKNFLLAALAVSAFLGAVVVAVVPFGTGIEFAMPIDVARR